MVTQMEKFSASAFNKFLGLLTYDELCTLYEEELAEVEDCRAQGDVCSRYIERTVNRVEAIEAYMQELEPKCI